jgi:hypothetical protein
VAIVLVAAFEFGYLLYPGADFCLCVAFGPQLGRHF